MPKQIAHVLAFLLCATVAGASLAAHGLALGGLPKYPAGFAHFDYVNPAAPKGGQITLAAMGNFDKLNPFTLKGVPPVSLTELVFETLVAQSDDEPFSVYGLLAEDMALAPDQLSISFRLNPKAKFSNGDPVTAEDVKHSWTMLISKAASPLYRAMWADVKGLVVVDPRTVRFEFKRKNRELHMIVGQLPVFSRKWGGGKAFDAIVTDTPLASGPYVVDKVDLGKTISYRRNPAYWGSDVSARRGMFNVDSVTYRYYKDELIRIEAFKAGEFDFVHENMAKNWARSYQGAKFDRGELIRRELTHLNPQGMQGYVFNLRRPLFQDVRVRKALTLALDFEWMNRQLFYNQYKRNYSYFTNSEMAATGTPDAAELKLLEPVRRHLEPETFGPVVRPPTTVAPRSLRENLREARELFRAAGWEFRDGALRNAKGEAFEFEIPLSGKSWERIVAPYARNLEKLGVSVKYRIIDSAILAKRGDDFDFDLLLHWFLSSQSPGNEQFLRFSSETADEKGSQNLIGLKNPGIDQLINAILTADTRAQLVTACRALDRALLAGHYMIPQWHNSVHRVSYKKHLGIPAKQPLYYQPDDWLLKAWWIRKDGEN